MTRQTANALLALENAYQSLALAARFSDHPSIAHALLLVEHIGDDVGGSEGSLKRIREFDRRVGEVLNG